MQSVRAQAPASACAVCQPIAASASDLDCPQRWRGHQAAIVVSIARIPNPRRCHLRTRPTTRGRGTTQLR